jgi:hypothetical protein
MLNLSVGGYTAEDVRRCLWAASGKRTVDFKFALLDKNDALLGWVDNASGNISADAGAAIKRTARFTLSRETDKDIDYANDRMQPWFRLKMPDGNCVEWPLGIFLLSSPTREEGTKGRVVREIDAYDKGQILRDDKFTSRHLIAKGTKYTDAVVDLLESAGIDTYNIYPSDLTLPITAEFEIGEEKLNAINELLTAINYTSLYFDAFGVAVARPYVSPTERVATETYKTDQISVIRPGAAQVYDYFNTPNVVIRYLSNPDTAPLVSRVENNNPASPLSTVSRGRRIVDISAVTNIANQEELDKYTQREAINIMQKFGELTFNTAVMPHHEIDECLYVIHDGLGIAETYIERSWTMTLASGGEMQHKARKVVAML